MLFLFVGSEALAHGGGLNAQGCHTNRKTGDYHCHRAQVSERPLRQQVLPSQLGTRA
ncbi:MAG: YHYH domain-containing protein [Paracoccaceae bacterium]